MYNGLNYNIDAYTHSFISQLLMDHLLWAQCSGMLRLQQLAKHACTPALMAQLHGISQCGELKLAQTSSHEQLVKRSGICKAIIKYNHPCNWL